MALSWLERLLLIKNEKIVDNLSMERRNKWIKRATIDKTNLASENVSIVNHLK
ncbi:hypothetical protein [Pseudobutyrivibrio xylanivorans]|uniref:hypothetical protein n=1 Tax=Pseudobutyrivibrio xylanivorans TaxID=185007 RepID=UPI00142EE74A|nr:hypothetical protein [Pseudobutyrivibrio xylanivorans]